METLINRPTAAKAQGWGTGHQGEATFSTLAPNLDYYSMPFGLPQRHNADSPDSFLSESECDLDIYGELDLGKVLGQQLAIWTHRSPDTVALFTPVTGDSFYNIVAFARESLQFDHSVDKIMLLLPGHRHPLDMNSIFHVKPGTSVLITPRYDYMVTLEVKQLSQKFDMVVTLTSTVLELKGRIQTERGYPVDKIDFLYRDRPMKNTSYLFECHLAHSSTIFVLLNLAHNKLVHVETFWGKRYHLYVDPCNTGLSIIASILRRTVSQNVTDVVRLYELFLPKHTLVLYLGSRVVDWNTCLGYYNIEEGHVLRMSTIGLAHDMAIQRVPVLMDSGRVRNILASKFDRWSAVVLKLHGMTGYPVNLMRLTRHSNTSVDFSDTIGYVSSQDQPVRLDISGMKIDDDLLYGVPLKFEFGHGVTELLKVAPNRTIKSVKDTLERVGVPNASLHDLDVDGYRLPNNRRVVDVIDEYKTPIRLVLRQYPVFVHGPQNVIYKMMAHKKESLATFSMRIKMKTGLSFNDYNILVNGMVLDDDQNKPVFHSRIGVRTSLFLLPKKQYQSFFIINNEWLNKLRLPEYPRIEEVKDILWKDRNIPEGSLASVGNFLQWYFAGRNRDKPMIKLKPAPKETMNVYEAREGKQYMQMKVENEAQKWGRPELKKRLDTDLKDLRKLAAKQDALRDRARSLPPDLRRGKIAHHLPRPIGHPMRRAHSEAGGHTKLRRTGRRKKTKDVCFLDNPMEIDEDRKERGKGEYVFALRHDIGYSTVKPPPKRKKRLYNIKTS